MILIINQHRGSMKELYDHIQNFIEVSDPEYFEMILVVDQKIEVEDANHLNDIAKSNKNIDFIFNSCNQGLSPSRAKAIDKAELLEHYEDRDYEGIIFGATNIKWIIKLDGSFYYELINLLKDGYPVLLPVQYDKDIMERSNLFENESFISYSDYFNCTNKPDYTLVIPWIYHSLIRCYPEEKYYPEENILYHILYDEQDRYPQLSIFPLITHKAWYNDEGLSKTFNRMSMRLNRRGFLERALLHLNAFKDGRLSLIENRLKYLMYDYATLKSPQDKTFMNDDGILGLLYWWTIKRWVGNKDHNHLIEFIEDVKSTD